jgi:hypothetical protein
MPGGTGSMSEPSQNQNDIDARIRAQVIALVEERGIGKTICPSEVARAVRPDDWRPLLKKVRQAAKSLADNGQISIFRKGKPIPTDQVRGVIRLGLPVPQ